MTNMTDHPPQDDALDRQYLQAGALMVFVLVAVVYGRVILHPFTIWDDVDKILLNPVVRNPGGQELSDLLLTPHVGYATPVTVLSWAGLMEVGDTAAWPFHLAGVVLHAVVCLLVFLLTRELVSTTATSLWSRLGVPLFAATLVAIHPVSVEPTCWATGLKDGLAATFALLGTWVFVRGLRRGHTKNLVVAVIALVVGMFAKPTVVLVGGAWFAWLALGWLSTRWRWLCPWPEDWRPKSPGPWAAAGTASVTGLVVGFVSRDGHDTFQTKDITTIPTGLDQVLLSLGHHLEHLLVPVHLHPVYRVERDVGWGEPHVVLGAVGLLAIVVALLLLLRARPLALLGALGALAAYVPVSSILPFPRFVADSYLYLPLAFSAAALLASSAPWWDRLSTSRQRLAGGIVSVVLLGLAVLCVNQVGRWSDPQSLWGPLIEDEPDWAFAWTFLGHDLMYAEQYPAAVEAFETSYDHGYNHWALLRFGLALLYNDRVDDGECVLIEAIHHSDSPDSALHSYTITLALNPERSPAYPSMASVLLPRARAAIQSGAMNLDANLLPGLDKQLERISPGGKAQPWPKRNCSVLR